MFVDAAAGDLHLAPGRQRIINQIPSLPDAAEDLDGEPRRPGGLVDYGADEPLVLPERAR